MSESLRLCEKCDSAINIQLGHFGRTLPIMLCTACWRALDGWVDAQPWGEELLRLSVLAAAPLWAGADRERCERLALAHRADLDAWLAEVKP